MTITKLLKPLILEEGEILCSNCEIKVIKLNEIELLDDRKVCKICHGTGKINWIDNIFGKEKPQNYTINLEFYREIMRLIEENLNAITRQKI